MPSAAFGILVPQLCTTLALSCLCASFFNCLVDHKKTFALSDDQANQPPTSIFFRGLFEKGGVAAGVQIKSLEFLEKLFPCSKQAGWEQPRILR